MRRKQKHRKKILGIDKAILVSNEIKKIDIYWHKYNDSRKMYCVIKKD